jgi:hypothetical protein
MPKILEDEFAAEKPLDKTAPEKDTVTAEDLSVDFGDAEVMARTGIQKILPTSSRAVRVANLTDLIKPQMAWSHFIEIGETKGSYRCLTERDRKGNPTKGLAVCCQALNGDKKMNAQLIIAVLALVYLGANAQGTFDKNHATSDFEVGWLKLSKSGFAQVSRMKLEDGEDVDFDFVISEKTNGIGFDYSKISNKCKFREYPEWKEEVMEAAAPYLDGVQLVSRLGRKITEIEWKAILSGTSKGTTPDKVNSTAFL